MKISCITNSSFCMPKNSVSQGIITQAGFTNNNIAQTKNTNRSQITFGNRPWELNPTDFGVSRHGSISGSEAITLFSQLKKGNYLDIGNDSFEYSTCSKIRENNLAFLDRLDYSSDKRQFIRHYQELTGFPNLHEVSRRIKRTFVNAVEQSERELANSKYNVLVAGYDGVCSVGRGKAFPGSDLDKAYVILRGTGYSSDDIDVVNEFRGKLWANTDQRLLSYNHDEAAFPQVYTREQIERLTKAIDDKDAAKRYRQKLTYELRSSVDERQQAVLNKYYDDGIATYMDDYVKANPYWVEYCPQFPKMNDDIVRVYNPSRENIKNVGFTLEAIREGEILKGTKSYLSLPERPFVSVNLSQLAALKRMGDRKPKRVVRDMVFYEFPTWNLDKQFRFIKTLIKSACANNREFTTEFAKYFSKPGQDMFAPLIKALMGNL
ncbi:hypothetical protein J6A34_08035 [bacterium]|nr:hypothetical protein [bacterium]